MILCALFAALTGVGALIAIPLPFTPVPITLQTFFIFLAGALLGKYLGALSQLIYLLLGVVGLPVFAKGSSGIGALLGPSGGYLVGFIPAAFLVGYLLERREKPPLGLIFLAMVVGLLAIYLPGVGWLMWVAKLNLVKGLLWVYHLVLVLLIRQTFQIYLPTTKMSMVRDQLELMPRQQ